MPRALSAAAVAFRDAPLETARTLITSGFELETQASHVDGHTLRAGDSVTVDTTPDEAAMRVAFNNRMRAAMGTYSELGRYAGTAWPAGHMLRNLTTASQWQSFYSAFGVGSDRTLRTFVERGIISQADLTAYRAAVEPLVRSRVSAEDFRRSMDSFAFLRHRFPAWPENIEMGTDGSVRGFEFRTRGGLTSIQFDAAADHIFGEMTHTVDNGCSFHIHVAVEGLTHQYGERFQEALIEYLVENSERAPDRVRARWRAIRNNRYILIHISDQKYSFVHKHPRFNTWEFRCFGNIDNAADAKVCRDLAVEAMQHAYKVISGSVATFATRHDLSMEEWKQACMRALENRRSLTAELNTSATA